MLLNCAVRDRGIKLPNHGRLPWNFKHTGSRRPHRFHLRVRGIDHLDAIDRKAVAIDTWIHRAYMGDPNAIRILFEVRALVGPFTGYADAAGIRRLQPEDD